MSGGVPGFDPPVATETAAPKVARKAGKIQQQVRDMGAGAGIKGGGTIFTEPVLVINQKSKLIEVNAEYAIYDQNGQQVARVRQVGENFFTKSYEGMRTRRLKVHDMSGQPLMTLTLPPRMWRSEVSVADDEGKTIGRILKETQGIIGDARYRLEAGGKLAGKLHAEDSRNFSVKDKSGSEVARMTNTWAGLTKELFTKADNYVVEIPQPLENPLRSLVIAAAIVVDIMFRQ